MENNLLLGFDDLVFEERNKSFGGYELRKIYNRNLGLAFTGCVSFVMIALISSYFYLNRSKHEEKEEVAVTLTHMEIPPVKPKAPEPPKLPHFEPPKISMVKFLPTEIRPDEAVLEEETLATTEQLKDANIGNKNEEGDKTSNQSIETAGNNIGGPTGPVEDENIYFEGVQETAGFPGGEEALQNYFIKNMDLIQAKRKGLKGRIILFFIIEKDGSISDGKLLKKMDLCETCNEEALRVLNNLPKWTPAKQNGRPVRLQRTLPILIDFTH